MIEIEREKKKTASDLEPYIMANLEYYIVHFQREKEADRCIGKRIEQERQKTRHKETKI